ncbi:MAG: protein kinase [Myxococcales bacterium]|nr:protein kinase [Myxococcales bacterium]
MGALYIAVTGDHGFERLMCIKTVLPHLADKEYVARFRDEAKIVVQLSHGNLIPVFDAGQVGGELFLAMDFVKGKDLRAVWNRCAKKAVAFPIDVAVHLTKELCRGLGYAHSFQNIHLVHRDVSPPNVLVSYSGELKLTDFGLASSTMKTEKTLPGIIYGKVAYMSPEQARGEALDGRSDVYAAGIILWELLTGRQLFPPGQEQPQDLLKRARDPEVPAPSKKAPRVPRELDTIVLKSLCAEPNLRYQSAEEFQEALGKWLAANHPSTDTARVKGFVGHLFDEDIVEEEEDRHALMQRTRDRVNTLPPTDELRRLLEDAGPSARENLLKVADRRQSEAEVDENPGRRGPDRGEDLSDRRGVEGRRLLDAVDRTQRRVVVDVPKPGPAGATAVSGGAAGNGAAVAAATFEDSVDDRTDIIGQILENRYEVSQLIGEGGMGRVYLAEHIDIGKKVAIKVLHPVYGRMPDLVERFRREARAASRIGHPNIVDVTDSGTTEDGSVYFVMEYLQGVELAAVIDREGAIDIRRALGISTQVCRALSAAHAVGIIHRDLKPENIFLTSREGTADFVKVLDFGIAKSSEAEEARSKKLTSPGMAMGTPEYMAPEQAAGKPADERCDVYALGAILYEMLTGTAPYTGDNFMEILTRKATLEPTPPREHRAEIPESVEELLMRAMSRSPDGRPPSMEAFEYELTKSLAGRGTAVAKILGISQEDSFDGATGFEGSLSGSSGVSTVGSGLHAAANQRPSQRMRAADPVGGVATPGSSETSVESLNAMLESGGSEAVPDVGGGGMRAFGWVFFASVLLGGGAAVLFVAKGEGDAQRAAANAETQKPAVVIDAAVSTVVTPPVLVEDPVPPPLPTVVVDAGAISIDDAGRSATTPSAPVAEETDAAVAATKPPNGKLNKPKVRRAGPPRNVKEARRLLSQARGLAGNRKWDEARERYERVVSGRFLKQRGYLGLADVAFQNKNAELAIRYAKKAGKGISAQMALGNGYFKKGDYRSALRIYNGVLADKPSHKEAQNSAKEARARLK